MCRKKRQRGNGYFKGKKRQRGGRRRYKRHQKGGFPLTAAAIALPSILGLLGLK